MVKKFIRLFYLFYNVPCVCQEFFLWLLSSTIFGSIPPSSMSFVMREMCKWNYNQRTVSTRERHLYQSLWYGEDTKKDLSRSCFLREGIQLQFSSERERMKNEMKEMLLFVHYDITQRCTREMSYAGCF